MIQATLAEKRTTQQYILLEGLFNNSKLEDESDKLALRHMDELFMIEKNIGEIHAVVSLQYQQEATQFLDDKWEEFEEPVVAEPKPKVFDEEGNEVPEVPAEAEPEEAEKKAPAFNPADFKWTVTNRRAKNLPQVFRDFKGISCVCEERASESFSPTASEAVTMSLDNFCGRIAEADDNHCVYQQVIFQE